MKEKQKVVKEAEKQEITLVSWKPSKKEALYEKKMIVSNATKNKFLFLQERDVLNDFRNHLVCSCV